MKLASLKNVRLVFIRVEEKGLRIIAILGDFALFPIKHSLALITCPWFTRMDFILIQYLCVGTADYFTPVYYLTYSSVINV